MSCRSLRSFARRQALLHRFGNTPVDQPQSYCRQSRLHLALQMTRETLHPAEGQSTVLTQELLWLYQAWHCSAILQQTQLVSQKESLQILNGRNLSHPFILRIVPPWVGSLQQDILGVHNINSAEPLREWDILWDQGLTACCSSFQACLAAEASKEASIAFTKTCLLRRLAGAGTLSQAASLGCFPSCSAKLIFRLFGLTSNSCSQS